MREVDPECRRDQLAQLRCLRAVLELGEHDSLAIRRRIGACQPRRCFALPSVEPEDGHNCDQSRRHNRQAGGAPRDRPAALPRQLNGSLRVASRSGRRLVRRTHSRAGLYRRHPTPIRLPPQLFRKAQQLLRRFHAQLALEKSLVRLGMLNRVGRIACRRQRLHQAESYSRIVGVLHRQLLPPARRSNEPAIFFRTRGQRFQSLGIAGRQPPTLSSQPSIELVGISDVESIQ